MCKSNESEVRRISSFVLTHELSLNDTKFRGYLCEISCLRKRNFAGAKIHACQISRQRNFADTICDAKRLNLMRTLKPA